MEERKIKLGRLPEMTESELCKYIVEKTRNRDLFSEKTTRARKFLEGLQQINNA